MYWAKTGSRVSFGQNFGERMARKQAAFQDKPARDGDLPAFTALATAAMSLDLGRRRASMAPASSG